MPSARAAATARTANAAATVAEAAAIAAVKAAAAEIAAKAVAIVVEIVAVRRPISKQHPLRLRRSSARQHHRLNSARHRPHQLLLPFSRLLRRKPRNKAQTRLTG